jgi:hypothetical protein
VTQKFSWDVLAGVPALLSDGGHDFVYGDGVTRIHQWDTPSNVVTYLHADRIGSVRALTNAAGVKVGTASYEAYGTPARVSGVGGPFGFAGSYTDAATGLLYLRRGSWTRGPASLGWSTRWLLRRVARTCMPMAIRRTGLTRAG